jgi:menaquinone-dependent protoporphyrinogen oxidase
MRVLVTAASKHGATEEMAFWIGDALRVAGLEAIVRPAADVATLDGFDAVVLGSGVYAGKWLGDANDLVKTFGPELQARQVWLFSSGPVGEPLKPEKDPVDVDEIREATGARDHRLFGGRVDRKHLGFAEWAIVSALRVPDGDFRPRPEVEAWAGEIASALATAPVAGAAG